jgi:hypothetical protein
MTVRINQTVENSKPIVSVAGRLDSPVVKELMKACHPSDGEFVLDLAELLSADTEGIEAIHKLVRGGAKLRGTSPFIRLLLDDQPPVDAD